MLTLQVTKRDSGGKARKERESGMVPAVFYGRKETSTSISVSERDFEKVWKEAGESSVITLSGVGDDKEALIHDVDFHPVSGLPRHVDFYIIEKGKTLEVSVPIEFEGIAPAVKELGGVLVKVLHELEVEALPKDLPHHIVVDISPLRTLESRIIVKDITLPSGVKTLASPDDVVVLVSEAEEEPEVPTEAPDLASIEVIKKGKDVEGEEDTAEESKE